MAAARAAAAAEEAALEALVKQAQADEAVRKIMGAFILEMKDIGYEGKDDDVRVVAVIYKFRSMARYDEVKVKLLKNYLVSKHMFPKAPFVDSVVQRVVTTSDEEAVGLFNALAEAIKDSFLTYRHKKIFEAMLRDSRAPRNLGPGKRSTRDRTTRSARSRT